MNDQSDLSQGEGAAQLSLGRRMASGALWLVGLRLVLRGLGLLSTLILARLLVPEDFGLVALASTAAAFLETASDFNFDLAIIRQNDTTRDDYDTAWTLNLIKALVVATCLYFGAGWLAGFFDDPRLEVLFELMALAVVIQGFWSVRTIDFRKNLELEKEFRFRVWAKVASFVIVVALAFWWRSYWALIVNIVLGRAILLILSYWLAPYRPRLCLAAWGRLIHFSKWLALNNLFCFLRDRMDTIVIGKYAGAAPLGLYSVAHEIADLPTSELALPVNRAVYPGFARMVDDLDLLRRTYVNSFALLILITTPIGVGIGLLAEPIVALFLGTHWLPAAPLIQALIVYGLLRTSTANANAIYLALGRVRIEPALTALFIVMVLPALVIGVKTWGVMGAACVLTAGAILNLGINLFVVARLLNISWSRLLSALWRTALATMAMAAMVLGLPSPWTTSALVIAWSAPIGAFTFTGVLLASWHFSGRPDGPERSLLEYMGDHFGWLQPRGDQKRAI
ncbi:MAG: lipopolysaccharide biosynthesis protein [Geminicoccaceae bacterium]|nr:lipopolysaccharide biosynthesis protein [Geminicoccaceae bacterium]MCB9944235.1 lipopolysaccharide biosynthesis protein [Geminicoccaceae bacterium]